MTGNNNITYTATTTICSGDDPSLIGNSNSPSPTLTGAVMEYQWQSFDGTNWNNIFGANSLTFDPGSIAVDTAFRRLASVNYFGVVCEDPVLNYISNVVSFTVYAGPTPSITFESNELNNTICEGDTVNFTTAVTGPASPSYLFRRGGVAQSSLPDTQSFLTVSNVIDGEIITVEVFPVPGRVGCSATETITMIVNSFNSNPNTIGIATSTICSGAKPSVIFSNSIPSASGSITYRWESKTLSGTLWTDVGSYTTIYYPPVLTNSTVFRRLVFSTLNGVSCQSESNHVTITIDPSTVPVITSFSTNRTGNTVCSSSSSSTIFTVTATGTPTRYDFRLMGTVVQSGVSNTYSIIDNTISNGDYVSVDVYNASGCFDSSYTITLTVNDILSGSITGNQTICEGQVPNLLSNVTTGTINGIAAVDGDYQWQSSLDGTNWNNITSENNRTYQPPNLPIGTRYYRRGITSTLNSQACSVFSNQIIITITPGPTVDFRTPDNVTVSSPTTYDMCTGSNAVFRASGGLSYEFRINETPFYTVGASNTADIVTYDPLVNGAVTYTLADGNRVDVIVYNTALTATGTIDYANACSSLSSSITVNVAALPDPTLRATNITGNVFCPDDQVEFEITLATPDASATYEYFRTGGGGTWIALGGTNTFTIDFSLTDNPGSSDNTTVTIRVSTASCTSLVTRTLFLQENDFSTAGTISVTDASVCVGGVPGDILSTAVAVPTIATASITYQWYQRSAVSTTTWSIVAGARGRAPTLTGAPLTESTQFRERSYLMPQVKYVQMKQVLFKSMLIRPLFLNLKILTITL